MSEAKLTIHVLHVPWELAEKVLTFMRCNFYCEVESVQFISDRASIVFRTNDFRYSSYEELVEKFGYPTEPVKESITALDL